MSNTQHNMKTAQGKAYAGPSGGLKKPSQWLASEDLADKEARVIIETAELYDEVEFDAGRTERNVGALKFQGKEKRMILNATNRKALVNLYGMNTADWTGKPVIVYVDFKVKAFGAIKPGLRLKAAPDSVRTISKAPSITEGGA